MTTEMINKKLSARLSRIEGQVRGIKRMLESESSCTDILIQIAAVKSAIQKVGMIVFEHNARECLCQSCAQPDHEDQLAEVVKMLGTILK